MMMIPIRTSPTHALCKSLGTRATYFCSQGGGMGGREGGLPIVSAEGSKNKLLTCQCCSLQILFAAGVVEKTEYGFDPV